MVKKCIVNRDSNGNPSMVLVEDINFNLKGKNLNFLLSEINISEPKEISSLERTNFDIKVGNDVIGHIEVKDNGNNEVQITHSALETGIDNSDETKNKNMETILSNFSPEVAKYLKNNNTNIVENKGKGIGKQAYIVLGNILSNKYGKTLVSDNSRTDEAEGLWNSLYRNGMARIRGEYNSENRASYTYEFVPTENVQVKEGIDELFKENTELASIGTPQQYSDYIDSIFPESKVKDIVYHLTNNNFESFDKNATDHIGYKTATVGFHFIESKAVEDYKHIYGKIVKSAILDFKNPIITDEYNSSDENHISQRLEFLKDENIEEFLNVGYDSGIIDRPNDTEYIAFNNEQIHVLGSTSDIVGFKRFIESNKDKNEFIPSQLYEQIRQLPFITAEQAVSVYKNIYRPNMLYWQKAEDTTHLDLTTREPKLYFKGDNNQIYSSLNEALKNSSMGYSTGFMNENNEFESFLETPIYQETQVKGKVQSLIKNDYLKPFKKEENVYEAQDSLSAEFIEEDLALTFPFAFERNENNFTITEPEAEKTFDELVKEVGIQDAIEIKSVDKYFELKNKKLKPKDVVYTEDQLYDAIQSFMKRVGISETSIANYKQNYKFKYGVEPNANAFIDINNKIIATINGKATLDELSEEVSHFIIEAWNQDEIKRLLPYVKNTSYYAQFAETYRNIYSKQSSNEDLVEEYVNKEILGKMLAESLQNDFTPNNKSDLEMNFFQKLGEILRNFISFIQFKISPKEVSEIEFFNTQIKNLLYNEELDKNLQNFSPTSSIPIMYSVPENMERLLKRFGKEIKSNISGQVEEEMAIQGALSIFNDRLNRAAGLLKEVKKYTGDNEGIIPSDISILSEAILKDREALELLRTASIRTARSTPQTVNKVNTIQQMADLTLRTISELSGEVQSTSDRDPVIVARELLDEIGENRDFVREALEKSIENVDNNGIRQAQKDNSQITALFGHVGKMSNAFINIMSSIVKKLHNDSVIDTNNDFNTFATKLIPYRNLLNKFYKGGNFISVVDSEKVREAKVKYEYQIRKQIGDLTVAEITEEDFLTDYDNIDKVEKGTPTYYAYDYLYKKNYSSQDWAEEDRIKYNDKFIQSVEVLASKAELEEGRSLIYNYLKNVSDRRNKYREGDPLRRTENQDIIEDRRRRSNIFNRDGSIKEGLSYIRYSEAIGMVNDGSIAKENIVSTNPKVVPFGKNAPGSNDFVVVLDKETVDMDGQLAFDLLKWNQLNLSEKGDVDLMKANFEEAYKKKLESVQSLPYDERNKILKDWVIENLQFDMTEEYWNQIDSDNVNYDILRNAVPEKIRQDINRLEGELNAIRLQKNNILKVYKLIGDYKEIDAEKIPSDDKLLLESLEIENYKVKQQIQQIFDDYSIPMYKVETNPIIELNQSFYEVFQKAMGVRYEDSSLNQKKAFFSGENGMSAEKYSMFLNFERSLSRAQAIGSSANQLIEKYKQLAEDPNSLDSIKEAYLKASAPSWYKRYDANSNYGNFTRDLNAGRVNVEELIDNYIKNDSFVYNNGQLNMMQISPSFKYTLAREATTDELYEQYLNTDNLKDKFNLLTQMGRLDKLKNISKEDVNWVLNSDENLKAYIYMMDYHLNSLKNNNALTSYNIFLRPQQRKGTLERYETFATKGNKLSQVKDALKERFQYREDDFVDAYRDGQIPKYGLYRINPEELTDDILGSQIWFSKQSNTYKNKLLNYSRAMRAISALEHQTFEKGKKSTDTNSYKIIKEMLNYNFFGKTTTMKMETNILGQKVDMAKVLMWFRGFAIKQALGFAPIVALTNVTSGITQNQFLKWTGKNIYSKADDRALKLIAPLTSDSIRDIGDFNPTSKLNKLMYSFGVYNIEDRFRNAKFNKTARLLPEAAFGMMAVGNYALQSRVTLSKLTEIRLIDNKFQSWRDYYLDQKRQDNTQTDKAIKGKFDQAEFKSMYDYLDDNGEFNEEKLKEDGYTGDIKVDKSRAMSRIQDIGEQVTMEIKNHNEGQAARDPLWSFALSLKKWLILANTNMFSRKRIDPESGGYEEGLIFSYKYMIDLIKNARKENMSLAKAYDNLEEHEQKNLKTVGIISASMVTLLALAFMLKKAADDDDEKDNYGLQLANYMMLRNLNETFSANVGIGNSMYEAIQSPIMTANTLGNMTKLVNVSDIGTEIKRGKYKGVDKYAANWIKFTSAKNIYTIKDANSIYETRKGYEFFTNQNALYHIFNMLPAKEDSGN